MVCHPSSYCWFPFPLTFMYSVDVVVLHGITNSNYNCITTITAIRGAVPRQRVNKPPNGLPERPDSTRRSTPHNVQGTYRLCTVPTVRQLGERNHQGRLPTSLVSGTCSFQKWRYAFKRIQYCGRIEFISRRFLDCQYILPAMTISQVSMGKKKGA